MKQWQFDEERWERDLRKPVIAAEITALDRAVQANKEISDYKPRELARQFVSGQAENIPGFDSLIQSMAKLNPEAYEAYRSYIQFMWNSQLMDERLGAALSRADTSERRAARDFASRTMRDYGVGTFQQYFDWYLGENVPEVDKILQEKGDEMRQRERVKGLAALNQPMRNFINAKGKTKEIAKGPLELQMSKILGAPVQILELPGS